MRKWLVGLIAAIAVISVGGVGFAAFTSTVTLQLNGAAGTLHVEWTGTATPATITLPAIPSDTPICSATLSPSSIVVTFKNIAPGDGCEVPLTDKVNLTSTGTLPGIFSLTNQAIGNCAWVDFIGPGVLFGGTIAPGANLPFTETYYLDTGQGNGCQGATIIWWLNFTATAGA